MKFSFVIPAYNEEAYLGACLESVLCARKGRESEIEVIVVNNASVDRTREVALAFPNVCVVDEPRKGLVHAREAGFRASTGELIANIDADTILPPQWIEKAERYFDRDPQVVAVSGPYIYHDLSWLINVGVWFFYLIGYVGHLFHRLLGHSGTLLQGGNFVLRRSALVQVGGYDLDYHFWGEDTAIAMKIGKVGKIVFTYRLPMYTSGRRLQEEGVLTMAGRYALNHVSTIFFRRPLSKEVRHIRK